MVCGIADFLRVTCDYFLFVGLSWVLDSFVIRCWFYGLTVV